MMPFSCARLQERGHREGDDPLRHLVGAGRIVEYDAERCALRLVGQKDLEVLHVRETNTLRRLYLHG